MYLCAQLDALNYKQEGLLQKIRSERSYVNEDEITVSPDHLPNYEQKVYMCVCVCELQSPGHSHGTQHGESEPCTC